MAKADPRVRARIEEWARKLIDLSRRNRLLVYRANKRSSLVFRQPDPDTILSRLLDGRAWSIYEPPPLPRTDGDIEEPVTATLDEVLRRNPPAAAELVADHRDPKEIERALVTIDRRSVAEFEDRGTHTLHLAWSLLRWTDPGSQEAWTAPILLVPLTVRRDARQRYELAPTEEDASFNPALRVKLENDFGIRLPDIDLEVLGPSEVIALLQEKLSALSIRWEVQPHAAIGLFSFAREPMYRDLVEHAAIVAESPAVQSLALSSPVPSLLPALRVDVPVESNLDAAQDPTDVFSVIDADSSQRQAIEAAVRGQSFVLFGPPGTGKSQTISNIISEFVARGRSVLFVSEKMAALEVVANRLREAELGDLLLELHSAKSSRSEVARNLAASLDESVVADDRKFEHAAASLLHGRPRLNEYVSSLHEIRRPLGRSVLEALAEVERLHSAPVLPAPELDASKVGPSAQAAAESLAVRLADAWSPVTAAEAFAWHGVAEKSFTPTDRQRVLDVLDDFLRATDALATHEGSICDRIAIARPSSSEARSAILDLGNLARQVQRAPNEWLTEDDLTTHAKAIDRWRAVAAERQNEIDALATTYGPAWQSVTLAEAGLMASTLTKVDHALGRTFDADSARGALTGIAAAAFRVAGELERAQVIVDRLRGGLGVRSRGNGLDDLTVLIEVSRISQQRHRPPALWMSRTRLNDAERFVRDHGDQYFAQQRASAALLELYDSAALDLQVDPLLDRMRRHYGKRWSLLRPSHRHDRQALMALTKTRRLRAEVLSDLEAIQSVQAMRAELALLEGEARTVLGPYASGLDTEPESVRQAVEAGRRLIELPHESTNWAQLSQKATFESPYDPSLDRDADQLEEAHSHIEDGLGQLSGSLWPAHLRELRSLATASLKVALEEVTAATQDAMSQLERFVRFRSAKDPATHEVRIESERRRSIHENEELLAGAADELTRTLHDAWRGFHTDWEAMSSALDWSLAVRRAYGGTVLPPAIADAILSGAIGGLDWDAYAEHVTELDVSTGRLVALFEDDASTAIASSLASSLNDARDFAMRLRDNVDQIETWIRYRSATDQLHSLGWGEFTTAAVARRLDSADLAPAMSSAWLSSWVRSVIAGDDRLAAFSRPEHERVIGEFRKADLDLIRVARERVLRRYEDGKPLALTMQGGEQTVVRREAVKRRRVLPVRTLLAAIPNLLPRIKPCLMMSPLSVSHFLAPTTRFDLVIFDEASQVPPEDAINCIYRGRQLIVAGDPKQLPPTDFFRLSASIESDLELDTDVDDFDSVLDLATASGFVSRPLRWHYRSQDDSLIAFSNQVIYDGSLITFPSPVRTSEHLGVSFVHCPNGVFDRGRTATNVIEARRVVEVVAEQLKGNPANSLGIVAFSVAQQQAIEDEWSKRLRAEPELESLAGSGRLHGMFIKNLETVQGDERDVIVFSIGYGRDESGRVLMNFGPLNRQGGWRRLNVAITRARRKIIVVSSIRADDLPAGSGVSVSGPPRGGDLLRAYLEYAEHGKLPDRPLAGASRGPAESPFELEVAQAIRGLGWDVVTQVGTSGYRIDIGVISRTDPSRFVLGVECDGMMYHSAKTARDRDRLRQGVLEGLGWRISRIWSQDWFGRRSVAIEGLRLELVGAEATAKARKVAGIRSGASSTPGHVSDVSSERPRQQRTTVELRDKSDAGSLPWTVPFPIAELPPYGRTWMDFHDPAMVRYHASMIGALVDVEGPIHKEYAGPRIARHFGLQRVGSRMAVVIDEAVREAERSGRIAIRGPFLWQMPRRELTHVRVTVPGSPNTFRTIERIPPEEIDLAILRLVEAAVAIDEASLRVAVARALGFDRTGDHVGEHIDARINAAVEAGRLAAAEGALTIASN